MLERVGDADLSWCLKQLGLSEEHFEQIRNANTLSEAKNALQVLKRLAKRNYRKASRELHPDINGGDATKTEQFKILSTVFDELDRVQVKQVKPVSRPKISRLKISYTIRI